MARARAVRSTATNFIDIGDGRSVRMVAGSIGAQEQVQQMPVEGTEPGAPPVDNSAWADELARREAAEGLPMVAQGGTDQAPERFLPGAINYIEGSPSEYFARTRRPIQPPADLSALPDRFSLEIERKPDGWWVVRAPGVHVGLFVAHQDLTVALADAPASLAGIVRLDGVVAKKQGRKS